MPVRPSPPPPKASPISSPHMMPLALTSSAPSVVSRPKGEGRSARITRRAGVEESDDAEVGGFAERVRGAQVRIGVLLRPSLPTSCWSRARSGLAHLTLFAGSALARATFTLARSVGGLLFFFWRSRSAEASRYCCIVNRRSRSSSSPSVSPIGGTKLASAAADRRLREEGAAEGREAGAPCRTRCRDRAQRACPRSRARCGGMETSPIAISARIPLTARRPVPAERVRRRGGAHFFERRRALAGKPTRPRAFVGIRSSTAPFSTRIKESVSVPSFS